MLFSIFVKHCRMLFIKDGMGYLCFEYPMPAQTNEQVVFQF